MWRQAESGAYSNFVRSLDKMSDQRATNRDSTDAEMNCLNVQCRKCGEEAWMSASATTKLFHALFKHVRVWFAMRLVAGCQLRGQRGLARDQCVPITVANPSSTIRDVLNYYHLSTTGSSSTQA